MQPNRQLPLYILHYIDSLEPGKVLPLGLIKEEPMLLVRLSDKEAHLLENSGLACEYKPSILLMPFNGKQVGLCIVQFRIDSDDRYIYTTYYDITEPKMYASADALLKMLRYHVVFATSEHHLLKSFDANFVGTFNPRLVLKEAKLTSQNSAGDGLASVVFEGFAEQYESPFAMWRALEQIAPAHKKWLLNL